MPIFNTDVDTYKQLGKAFPELMGDHKYVLINHIPAILKSDLDNGYLTRYFARQSNHASGEITEISKQQYLQIHNSPMFRSATVAWRIAGDLEDIPGPPAINTPTRLYTGVITANKLAIASMEEIFPGMQHKLIKYDQFYQG